MIPFGSVFAGTTFQFPLIWESSLVTVVMIPAGVLCYRDDTGRTQAEKLAQRLRWFRTRPALATFLVMFVILNVAYFVLRRRLRRHPRVEARDLRRLSLAVSRKPRSTTRTDSTSGRDSPARTSEGHWNGWMTAQPNGRPTVNPVKADGYCRPDDDA